MLAGCSQKPSGQTSELRFGVSSALASLDPYGAAATADGRSMLFSVFEGLVKPDTDGNLLPACASAFRAEDGGKVYVFTMRENLKFHGGADVTALDAKYSVETAKAAGFENFEKIEAVSASGGTLTITLNAPDMDFLPNLTNAIIPEGSVGGDSPPPGTGPFSIEEFRPDQYLMLKKNPDYWQSGLPRLDRVTFVFQPDSAAARLALQGGGIDGAEVDYSVARAFEGSEDFSVYPITSDAVQLLALNNNYEPLADARVRRALCHAVNKGEIIDTVFYGHGVPSGSPVPPGFTKYFNDTLTNAYDTDTEKAKALLAEAGFPNGFDLEITVPSNYKMHVDTAQLLVNQLGAAGIRAAIKQVDWGTWLSDVYQGRNYQATVISLDGSVLSPEVYLARWASYSGSNFANYQSAEYDEVYSSALAEADGEKRKELFMRAQEILSNDAASVFIQDISGFRVMRRGYDGVLDYPLYVFDAASVSYTQ
jgi:peptide/nickel transport system substrate-binding protein